MYKLIIVASLIAMMGCTTIPSVPTVPAYVGQGKSLEQFDYDSAYCRQYAHQHVTPQDKPLDSPAATTIIAGLLGAGLGAAVGAATGNPGTGAAIGGATGVGAGAIGGTMRGDRAAMALQQQYDFAYARCMKAYSHMVPGVPMH